MVGPPRQLLLPLLVVLTASGAAWGKAEQDKILLQDVKTLTLYSGKYTNYRRTTSILQLECTGGKAGCSGYTPEVVQCYNRGWDGNDVQWECKADLDNSYRFGRIEVSCEGYDYPNDPYILKGSCGLQYTLELTKGGHKKSSYFGSNYDDSTSHDSIGSGAGVVLLIIFGALVYCVYKLFLCDNRPQHGFTNGDGYSGTYQQTPRSPPPPPPGFKSETYGQNHQSPPSPGFNFAGPTGASGYDSNSGPGFWTGLGTGGLLGYLAGNRRSSSFYSEPSFFNTWARPSAPPPTFGSSSETPHTSGTRPTSGFGGTKRR